MSILGFTLNKTSPNDKIREIIKDIRQGNSSLQEQFIYENKSFIINTVLHTLGKSTLPKNSPEFGIALSAFTYSIENFNFESKKTFFLYSEQVIKEWVISYLRDTNSNPSSGSVNIEKNYLYYAFESKEEIALLKKRLWEFGIKLDELPFSTPENKQLVYLLLRIANKISKSDVLFEELSIKKNIPLSSIGEDFISNKKVISKYKKFIIALTFILKSELAILKSYLKNIETEPNFQENMGVVLEKSNDKAILFTITGKFIIIKHSKNLEAGAQIQFGNYRIKRIQKPPFYYSSIAASALTLLVISLLFVYASNNSHEVNKSNQELLVIVATPTDNEKSAEIDEPKIEESPLNVVIANPTDMPSVALPTSKPSPVMQKSPSPIPTQTLKPEKTVEPRPPTSLVANVPDEVRISASSYKTNVLGKYEIHMYMKSGNNGTKLVLYQNDKVYKTFDLIDRTPGAQAKIIEIRPEIHGVFEYRWELSNKFGMTSSKTISVTVTENIEE